MTNEHLRLWMYRFLSFASKTENRPPSFGNTIFSLVIEAFFWGSRKPTPVFLRPSQSPLLSKGKVLLAVSPTPLGYVSFINVLLCENSALHSVVKKTFSVRELSVIL